MSTYFILLLFFNKRSPYFENCLSKITCMCKYSLSKNQKQIKCTNLTCQRYKNLSYRMLSSTDVQEYIFGIREVYVT